MKSTRYWRAWLPVLLIAWTSPYAKTDDALPTQGAMRAIHKDNQGLPREIDLPLKHTDVQAEISGFTARVKVTQTFSNPYPDPIEAVYVFPLPQNAAVGDMQIRIGDRVVRGVIKKREEARKIYDDAKKSGKTAALLEQDRPNIFMQSVANIMPGADILVEIIYDEILKYEKGGYEFVFPMVVGPRFIPGNPVGQQAGGWSPDTDQVPDASRITPPVLKPGERSGHDISLAVKINAGLPIRSMQSPSHQITCAPLAGADGVINGPCTITLSPADAIPNKDFVLRYVVAGPKPEIGLLTHKNELGGYFMLMFQPPEAPAPETITPKEMVFVVDCSGSMNGEPIALAKKAVRYALQNLNPDDTFQIIRFSEAASPFAKEPLPNTVENVRRGLSYINNLAGEGGTMMIEGIKAALDYPHRDNRLRIVCFMTDGYIGNETEILHAIEQRLGDNTRLFSFGVGSSVNRYLLDQMAEVGRGEVQYVLLNEKPEETVNKFYERVRNPVVTHIRVDWDNLDVTDIMPARVRDLFAGQPIFILGRYNNPGRATVQVHAKIGGRDVTYDIPVQLPATNPDNGALAQLWARARIKELSGEQYGGPNQDVIKTITELALKYRLMSEYTSFVAVEEKVVNEGGQMKTIQVPVEMPEGVSYDSVFGKDRKYDTARGGVDLMMASPAAGGFFAGRSAGGRYAGLAVAAGYRKEFEPAMTESDAVGDKRQMPREDEALSAYTIDLKLDTTNGTELIQLTLTGDIWHGILISDNEVRHKYLKCRLLRTEAQTLGALVARALKEDAGAEPLAVGRAGTLIIKVFKDNGVLDKEVTRQLVKESGKPSESWRKVIELLEAKAL